MSAKRNIKKPSKIAALLLGTVLLHEERSEKLGDFEEVYRALSQERGFFSAAAWYWVQIIRYFPTFINNVFFRSTIMLKNYFWIALRNLKRSKGFTFINVFGLATGIAASILILLYVQDELNYDGHHKNAENVYRIDLEITNSNTSIAYSPVPLGPKLKETYPEVVESTKFFAAGETLIGLGEERFYETAVFFVDNSLFDLFTVPLARGDENTALSEPNKVIISEKAAQKYFGTADPIGRLMSFRNGFGNFEATVSGVAKPSPQNSFLQFDFVLSFPTLQINGQNAWLNNWGYNVAFNFIQLQDGYAYKDFQDKVYNELGSFMGLNREISMKINLLPLKELHFQPSVQGAFPGAVNKAYIYALILVAGMIILIACVNFMNLSTARSAKRANEVGMRKVVGARRSQLITQFIGESVILSMTATLLGAVLIFAALPGFNAIVDKTLQLNLLEEPAFLMYLLGLMLFVGFVSGSYPALFLSSFDPAKVFKGSAKTKGGSTILRKGLVVLQYTASTALIVSTIVIYQQLTFMQTKDLGFDKEQVMILQKRGSRLNNATFELIKNELLKLPEIRNISFSNVMPGFPVSGFGYSWQGAKRNEVTSLYEYEVDHNFLEMFDMEMVGGSYFSADNPAANTGKVLLNEAAVAKIGWDDPVGKKIFKGGKIEYEVIGVIKNFHIRPLHSEIEPVLMRIGEDNISHISVKLQGQNVESMIGRAQQVWEQFIPDWPFDYSFLDTNFENFYVNEAKVRTVFSYFSLLAIVISCLGLFGLASFSAEQRAKEIGIRKVLGATISRLVSMFYSDFGKLVIIANVFAWPLAYYVMQQWLQSFAYKIDIAWSVFLIAGAVSLVVALSTISYQTIKSAVANPVYSLKNE